MTVSLCDHVPQRVVYDLDDIEEGDFVAYPGVVYRGRGYSRTTVAPEERDPRDWLEVRRIEDGHVIGVRVNPQDWEAEQEYHVFPIQLRENGVELVKARG